MHGKTEAVGLARTVVRILSDDDHADLVERAMVESCENPLARRITDVIAVLVPHERSEPVKCRSPEIWLQTVLPPLLKPHIHASVTDGKLAGDVASVFMNESHIVDAVRIGRHIVAGYLSPKAKLIHHPAIRSEDANFPYLTV